MLICICANVMYMCLYQYIQISQYLEQEGEYGLNIDTDVALWLDTRKFQKKPTLRKASGFVTVDMEIHDEFDEFKEKETSNAYSLLENIDLLKVRLKSHDLQCLSPSIVEKFGKEYVRLHYTDMDSLCSWVLEVRDKFTILGKEVFRAYSPKSSTCFNLQSTEEHDAPPEEQETSPFQDPPLTQTPVED